MANSIQTNSANGLGIDPEHTFETINAFAVPADHEDQFLNAQYGVGISGCIGDGFPSLDDAFNEQGISSGLSSGFVTPDLMTRSNTPNSDTSRHIPSPGTGPSIAHNDKPVYRSRLPRRRSLYSRQGPPIRQSLSPHVSTGPTWPLGFSQAIDTQGTYGELSPTPREPLRRSDSTTSLGSECSNSSTHSTVSASSAASRVSRSSSANRRSRKKQVQFLVPRRQTPTHVLSSARFAVMLSRASMTGDDMRNLFI
jgi:hypothetical protein